MIEHGALTVDPAAHTAELDGKPVFLSNHAGGILGGISSGQPIVARFARRKPLGFLGLLIVLALIGAAVFGGVGSHRREVGDAA